MITSFTQFPIHYSLIILSVNTTQSEFLSESLNESRPNNSVSRQPPPLTWSHGIKAWNWFCVQIVMFAGMKWDFHIRLTHLPNLASPETSTIDKILALNDASTCANSNHLPILVQNLLHSTVLYNLQSCQPT